MRFERLVCWSLGSVNCQYVVNCHFVAVSLLDQVVSVSNYRVCMRYNRLLYCAVAMMEKNSATICMTDPCLSAHLVTGPVLAPDQGW